MKLSKMKTNKEWQVSIGAGQTMTGLHHRYQSKRPVWIIILVSLVCVSLLGAYIYPPRGYSGCYFLSSSICSKDWLPPVPARVYTDEEIAARVVFRDIIAAPFVQSNNPKIAFMFLTPGSLPFEKLWEKFFQVHLFNLYII